MRGEWTPQAIDLLKTYLGSHKAKHIAQLINKRLGTDFNATSIHEQTKKLGLQARRNTGEYIVTDAAKEIGITDDAFRIWARHLGITITKSNLYSLVTIEDVERMRHFLAPPPEPCLSVKQTATRLGVTDARVRDLKRCNRIRYYKRGWELLVPVAEVERIERERRGG